MLDVVVDLSHWESPVDFKAAKDSGIAAVILKATQGSSWVDATYALRVTQARSAGLLVAAYAFLDASSPKAQADHLLSVAGGSVLLAADIEANAMTGGTVTVAQAAEVVARLHMATGRMPLVYMGRYGPDRKGTGLPNSILSRCPLWLPEYGMQPIPPKGWTDWTLWQYTDGDVGMNPQPVPGIGKCDRSRFNGSLQDLAALFAPSMASGSLAREKAAEKEAWYKPYRQRANVMLSGAAFDQDGKPVPLTIRSE